MEWTVHALLVLYVALCIVGTGFLSRKEKLGPYLIRMAATVAALVAFVALVSLSWPAALRVIGAASILVCIALIARSRNARPRS